MMNINTFLYTSVVSFNNSDIYICYLGKCMHGETIDAAFNILDICLNYVKVCMN